MTALENLLSYYNQLPESSTTKAVLRRCLENIHQIGALNIYELAELCYTSPATISRLSKALGYKSYSVFQTTLAEHCGHYDFHNRFSEEQVAGGRMPEDLVMDAMRYNMAEFERQVRPETYMPLVDALHAAKRVVIFAYGILFMENSLQSDLIMSNIMCDIIYDDKAQLHLVQTLGPGDLAVYMFPDTVESAATLRTSSRIARKNGVTIAVLSSSERQIILDSADYTLSFHGKHYMQDSFYLEMLLATIMIAYRAKYLDPPAQRENGQTPRA